MRRLAATLLIALPLFTLPAFGDVTIESNAVVATVTPFAETAWMSVNSSTLDWTPWYVTDTDGDGVVRLEYPGGVPAHGHWLGVDLASGATMSIRTYFGSPLDSNQVAFPPKIFLRDSEGEYSQFALPGSIRAFLLVRPGTGVWYFQGAGDELLTATVANFLPLGPAVPVPSGVEPGDLFFSIDHATSWYGDAVDSHLAESDGPGVLGFTKSLVGVYENFGSIEAMVLRTEGTDGTLQVGYATVDQTAHAPADYEHRAGTLTFAQGERVKMIEVPLVNNSVNTGIRRFRIELSNGDVLEVQIADDDDGSQLPLITVDDTTAVESSVAQFAVHLSEPSINPIEFTATTEDGSAMAGVDFEATTQTIMIPPGQTSATITIPLLDDTLDEPDEAFLVTFSNSASAVLATTVAEGVIVDDDAAPAVAVADVRVSEKNGAAIFTLRLMAESADTVTVSYETVAGTASAPGDYTHSVNEVRFAPGEMTKTVSIPIVNDRTAERDETFHLRVGAATMAKCTIVNDDPTRARAVRH